MSMLVVARGTCRLQERLRFDEGQSTQSLGILSFSEIKKEVDPFSTSSPKKNLIVPTVSYVESMYPTLK